MTDDAPKPARPPRDRKFKLELDVMGAPILEGRGENLEYLVKATRRTKGGRWESYELRLKACRGSVKQLAEQIALMQQRDRDRIAHETDRLRRELADLVVRP